MKKLFKYFKSTHYYSIGKQLLNDRIYREGIKKSELEYLKTPNRTAIINYIISVLKRDTFYLEIGVRNPEDNFNKIKAKNKYSVDPGLEFKSNPVDFQMTSDLFFEELRQGLILDKDVKFDVIFIDGLHLADQVDKDIINALDFIKDDGFIVLHDCNPPTEWHARETFNYHFSPAGGYWNGTTWKAFMKWRFNADIHSCCIDSDSGVGILSKNQLIGNSIVSKNLFFEFSELANNRKEHLNLISFDDLKKIFS
tara:strand:- start:42 stop:800 length:759 start_codon:yes stop_codon:yes gene_type:complete